MPMTRWLLAFLLLPLLAVLLPCRPAGARTWFVTIDKTGDLPTIQDALEAATVGDTVLVGPGTYNWVNQQSGDDYALIRLWVRQPDGVVLRSLEGPERTILDAQRQSRVLFANGDNNVDPVDFRIEGFTLTRGVAPARENRPEREGGGMAIHLVQVVFSDCVFLRNEAEYGGGIWVGGETSAVFEDCRFEENDAAIFGGALAVVNSSVLSAVLRRCTLVGNSSTVDGGGLGCWSCDTVLEDCVLVDNQAEDDGSAIAAYGSHPLVIRRSLLVDNQAPVGSACLVKESVDQDGGTHVSDLRVDHSLIAFNTPGSAMRLLPGSKATFSCTDIFANPGGNWIGLLQPFLGVDGNVSSNPLFCDDADRRSGRVCADSPLLASVSGCEHDIGLAVEGCAACGEMPPPPPPSTGLVLHPTAPNPFPLTTTARYDLPRLLSIRASVLDLTGRLIKVLHDGPVPSTSGELSWDGTDSGGRRVASGVYLCRLESEAGSATRRMVLLH